MKRTQLLGVAAIRAYMGLPCQYAYVQQTPALMLEHAKAKPLQLQSSVKRISMAMVVAARKRVVMGA